MTSAQDSAAGPRRPLVVVHPDPDVLAAAAGARLINALADAQAARGSASVVLTGGGVGVAILRSVRDSPARSLVAWERVDVWWGDERFVPAGSGDRNDGQAREALLDHVGVDPERVFPMGAPGDPDSDVEDAARRYTEQLARRAAPGAPVPAFDVLLLGVGPEGHTASLFPDTAYVRDTRPVVAVHDCPKPPPTRISLTLPSICAAEQVWVAAAGTEKAGALAGAHGGASPVELPVAGARGRERTLWLLDRAAAKNLG